MPLYCALVKSGPPGAIPPTGKIYILAETTEKARAKLRSQNLEIFDLKQTDPDDSSLTAEEKQQVAEAMAGAQARRHIVARDGSGSNDPDIVKFFRDLTQRRGRLSARQRCQFLRVLSTMIGAGLPIGRALDVLQEQVEADSAVARQLGGIGRDVREGNTLSISMERSGLFPMALTRTIQLGDQSGKLSLVLMQLADHEEKRLNFELNLKSKLAYPAVALVLGTLLCGLLFYVMRQLVPMQEGLPESHAVSLVAYLGKLLSHPWAWLLIVACSTASCFLAWRLWKIPRYRYFAERRLLALPWIGQVVRLVECSRLVRLLAIQLQAGNRILESLEMLQETSSILLCQQALARARSGIQNGNPLGESLGLGGFFPSQCLRFIITAEEAGQIDTVLPIIATYQEMEVQSSVDVMIAAMEPLLLIILAIVVIGMLAVGVAPAYRLLETL